MRRIETGMVKMSDKDIYNPFKDEEEDDDFDEETYEEEG